MKILIGGDSWGNGEWPQETNHRGIWQYFEEDGHEVMIKSVPGESNKNTIPHMCNYITEKYNHDYIFWFQSDPLRDLRPYDDFGKTIKNYQDLLEQSEIILDKNYRELNNRTTSKIYCIGGCSKLNLKLISKYENLIPIVESLTELIFDDYVHPKLWHSDWLKVVDIFELETINLLLDDKRKQDSLAEVDKYREYFWPDGYHPNRKGHKVLYEFLCQNLGIS
jgi:hypothetical protein